MLHVALGASVVQPLVCVNGAPDVDTLVTDSGANPVLVSVVVRLAVVLTVTLPKANDAGARLDDGTAPVIAEVSPPALSVAESDATDVGEKVTVIEQDAPAANEPPQVFACEN